MLEHKAQPFRISDYIRRLKIIKGGRYFLVCRVSCWRQDHTKNLDDQERTLRAIVERGGGIVVGVVRKVGPGWYPNWLYHPAKEAGRLGAILLAETVDRFIRSPAYHSVSNPTAQAGRKEMKKLKEITGETPMMTVADPDATPGENRSKQIKRGLEQKGKKGGRKGEPGYKKRRRERLLPKAKRMRRAGKSLGTIGKALHLPKATIQSWFSRNM